MSQHDLTIANQGFPAFRADLNTALQALGSTQSGTAAPSPTFANQLWYDTANNILKIRNEDNDAWISIATLDQSGDLVALLVANTVNSVGDASISGLTVGKGGGAVGSNTAVGASALANGSNTGAGVSAFGSLALQGNTTGDHNNAFGRAVLQTNTTGAYNSAFGSGSQSALQLNTTGSNNSAFGSGALFSNTTASNNTAVGYQAGYSNATGTQNCFFGYQTGYANTTGFNNTAFGERAGNSLTTSRDNTFIGQGSGFFITTGSKNSILGMYNGNQNGLDIRTSSNYAVISDGDGVPLITTSQNRTTALEAAVPNTGTGITFPASQNASSNANTLDDYEEGTWSPTASVDTGSITSYTSIGRYTKVGRMVNVWGQITVSAVGTAVGPLNYQNLPFPTLEGQQFHGLCREAVNSGTWYVALAVGSTGTIASIPTGGAISWVNGNSYRFSVTYQVD